MPPFGEFSGTWNWKEDSGRLRTRWRDYISLLTWNPPGGAGEYHWGEGWINKKMGRRMNG